MMRNLNAVYNNLKQSSQLSRRDIEHFAILEKYIFSADFAAALQHLQQRFQIDDGVTEYKKQLVDLMPHLQTTSKIEANDRLVRLLKAIKLGEYSDKSVPELLATGSLIAINEVYHGPEDINLIPGETPLIAALKEGDVNTIIMLMRCGADFRNIGDINAPLNPDGDTALHLACKLGIPELIRKIQAKNPDLGKVNSHGFTAVQLAKETDENIYKLIKSPLKARKHNIIKRSRSALFSAPEHPLDPLFQALHTENVDLPQALQKRLEKIYFHHNDVMRPLLDVTLLAAQGKHHPETSPGKQLRIIITDENHISGITPARTTIKGLYTGKSTIYAAGFHGHKRLSLAVMLHELKHFADKQIFGDLTKPYLKGHKIEFMQLMQTLQNHTERFFRDKSATADEIDINIYISIRNIYNHYKPADQPAEVLVKVCEIIGYLGVNKGYAWLQKNEPELLTFYVSKFNPACRQYLAEKLNQSETHTAEKKTKL